jgi:hypothetical protein
MLPKPHKGILIYLRVRLRLVKLEPFYFSILSHLDNKTDKSTTFRLNTHEKTKQKKHCDQINVIFCTFISVHHNNWLLNFLREQLNKAKKNELLSF